MERRTIEVKENDCFAGTQQGVNLPVYYHDSVIAVIGITGAPEAVRKYAHLAERITLLLIREKELNAFRRTQEEERHYLIHNLLTPRRLGYQAPGRPAEPLGNRPCSEIPGRSHPPDWSKLSDRYVCLTSPDPSNVRTGGYQAAHLRLSG